jgi:CheY-like chemotaxis protein
VRLTCALAEKTESDVLLRFSVADAGVGMTPVQLASQKALFSGETIPAAMNLDSGNLALVVCARLFHMMGGATEITSDFGYGATYSTSIRFGVACATLDHRSAIFATQRALVVEANDAVRSSLVDMLVGFSMRASGLERQERIVSALRAAEQQQDPFTLLVVDWRPTTSAMHSLMVGIHDAALAFPPMVIATLSTHIHEETLSLDKYGLSAVIYKPVNVSLLFDALVNLLIGKKSARLPAKDPAADPPPDRLDGMRILLVEDNRINQQIAGELLGGAGAAISFANNGLEALRVLQERGVTAFDLALMDLQMPEMNGLDATKAIRALGPFTRMSLPVIAMTANADAQEVTECLRAGMNGHTVKPITVSRLFDVVKNWAPLAPSHSPLVLAMVEKLRLRLPELPLPPDLAEKTLLPLLPLAHTGRTQLLMDAMTQNDPEPLRSLLDDLEELARLRAPAAPADAPTTENIEGGRQ